jgi:hypothetical protein
VVFVLISGILLYFKCTYLHLPAAWFVIYCEGVRRMWR